MSFAHGSLLLCILCLSFLNVSLWTAQEVERCGLTLSVHFLVLQDFGLTAAIAFLWLVCSSAWAKGLQNVKDATSTAGIISTLALCTTEDVTCEVAQFANMRTLNVSVVRNGLSTGVCWKEMFE